MCVSWTDTVFGVVVLAASFFGVFGGVRVVGAVVGVVVVRKLEASGYLIGR